MVFRYLALSIGLLAAASSTYADSTDIVKKAYQLAEKQYSLMLDRHPDADRYPRSAGPDGQPLFTDSRDWTGGFWPGCLWYLYEYTGDTKWKAAALRWTESLEKNQFNTHHHDIGFVMNCSYGNAYRLTGDTTYKSILIQSAKSLVTRFDPNVGAIKSWNTFSSWDGKSTYDFPVIIDNMMNLELLFLASRLSGDPTFKNIAIQHAETTLKHHYRPDYSSYHVVNYDPTGKVLSKETAQGFSDNSAWARGQAWGLYGYTLMYRETRDQKYLDAAINMAAFYIEHERLPADHIPYWDFNALQDGYQPNWNFDPTRFEETPRDASAAAITSSALLELADYVHDKKQRQYREMAESILRSLGSPAYSAAPGSNGYLLLKHSVGSIPHNGEIDVPLVYADYYYLEALKRLEDLHSRERNSLAQAKRILFLGNSITYAGEYVSLFETYFRMQYPSSRAEIINAGLPSETVSGLSEPNHADGKFPRPHLFDRLGNLLNKTRPDVVFACYGMNDGIYMPFSADRFSAFKTGILRLRDQLQHAGVKRIILLTPPIHDDPEKGVAGYNLVLDRYTDWLLEQQNECGWEIIDLHYPMRTHLIEQRNKDSTFRLAADGIHPQSEGHWLMAKSIFRYLAPGFDATTLPNYLDSAPQIREIYALVCKRQTMMKDAWLTYIGHNRPNMQTGLPIKAAQKRYRCMERKIRKSMESDTPPIFQSR